MTRPKIGLALSGGGARGFAHVGAIKVLVDNGIPIDMIAGTSAGSIVGAAFACGMSVEEIIAMSAKVGWSNFTRPSLSPLGLLTNAPMGNFLKKHLKTDDISQTKIPFAAVSYDLERGERVVFSGSGDLITAIRSSCAVPGVFMPVIDAEGRFLVDGGVVCPTPADVVKELGADIVIAIDLITCGAAFRTRPRTAVGMMFISALALIRAAAKSQHPDADVVIEPQIAHLRPDEIGKRNEFIELGEAAAQEKLDIIKKIIRN